MRKEEFLRFNEKLRFVKVNNAAVEKYGYSRRKFLKMNIDDIHMAVAPEILTEGLIKSPTQIRGWQVSGNI